MMKIRHLMLVMAVSVPAMSAGQTDPNDAVLTTPHFAFYSDLQTNLHDALIDVATVRRANQPDPFSRLEQACFDSVPAADRASWHRAVDYYVAGKSTNAQRLLQRMALAGYVRRDQISDGPDRQFLDEWTGIREAATAAYRQCRWPPQDALNRGWIDHVRSLLAMHEDTLGQQLPQLFGVGWAGLPFRVDVVNTAGFSGANSATPDVPTLHTLVSSTNPSNQGQAALEAVFHEASHFLSQPGSPLSTALLAVAKDAGAGVPNDVLHEVQFFMTGEAVRRAFARSGGPAYRPYLFSLNLFSERFRLAIARTWPAYMDGTRTLSEAAADLGAALNGRP